MGCWLLISGGWPGIGIPGCFDEHIAARLLEVFNRPRALMDGAELVGDPFGVLPVLYQLLWKQLLVADRGGSGGFGGGFGGSGGR